MVKIALAADHAGFALKEKIRLHLAERGLGVEDLGTDSSEPVDYPDFARLVSGEVAAERVNCGILVCGTGIGMSIAANKMPGIRAANAHTEVEAQLSREHNDANVLTLGARVLDEDLALKIVDRWLSSGFTGGHHQRRVEKIGRLERAEARTPVANL